MNKYLIATVIILAAVLLLYLNPLFTNRHLEKNNLNEFNQIPNTRKQQESPVSSIFTAQFSWQPYYTVQTTNGLEVDLHTIGLPKDVSTDDVEFAVFKNNRAVFPTKYFRTKTNVYYLSYNSFEGSAVYEVEGANRDTFAPLYVTRGIDVDAQHFALDSMHVFSEYKIVDGADPLTIEPLFDRNQNDGIPSSYPLSGFTGYLRDMSHVYKNNKIIEGVDARTFEYINYKYIKDKFAVYYDFNTFVKLDGADPKTFTAIESPDSCTYTCFVEGERSCDKLCYITGKDINHEYENDKVMPE